MRGILSQDGYDAFLVEFRQLNGLLKDFYMIIFRIFIQRPNIEREAVMQGERGT
jgi:hypothetical protein